MAVQGFDFDAELVALIAGDAVEVPPFPAVAAKLNRVIQKPDYSVDELSKVIRSDQALSACVLRYANSAVYKGASEVTELTTATVRVGVKNVVKLALAQALGPVANREGPLSALRALIWRQGLFSAIACQLVATHRKMQAHEAFMCGLLHDFGKVIALAAIETMLKKHDHLENKTSDEWLALVERYSHELGVVVSAKWNLTAMLTEVIATYREPEAALEHKDMVALVHSVHELAQVLEDNAGLSPEEFAQIGFEGEAEQQFVRDMLQKVPQAIASFEIDEAPRKKAKKPTASAVTLPTTTLKGVVRTVIFPCSVLHAKVEHEFEAFEMATNGFTARGKTELKLNALVRVTVEGTEIWAKVALCAQDGDDWFVQFQPYGLGGDGKQVYEQLYRAAA